MKKLLLFLVFTFGLHAQTFTNYPAATVVLGQTDFVTKTSGISATKMAYVTGISIDPTTGKLFIADNHRILRFASAHALVSGAAAEGVLGQTDFTTNTSGLSSTKFNTLRGININRNGTMWVADYGNNRILRFDNVSSKADGAAADAVLGQTDFVTSATSATQAKTGGPVNAWEDKDGRLWVSCYGQHRVLRFDAAASKTNGANADGVLGQIDFTTATSGLSATKFASLNAVYTDPSGNLWVSDQGNKRVLKFANAAAKVNGAPADAVLGQPDFVTNSSGVSQSKFGTTRYVSGDQFDNIYVSLEDSRRLLVFRNASTLANGADANYVIGQPDFVTNTALNPPTANSLDWTRHSVVDTVNQELWVCDYNDNRVLKFKLEHPLPVELSSFTASVKSKSVELIWKTATEKNNLGFDIERSSILLGKPQNWYKVGFVQGSGSSTLPKEYNFVDKNITSGKYFYRLKQLDYDGNYEYSKEIEVDLGMPTEFSLAQNYPNPFNPVTIISWQLAVGSEVSLEVYNVLGKKVAALVNEKEEPGTYTIEFSGVGLASGTYFYRLQAGGLVQTKKFILMK